MTLSEMSELTLIDTTIQSLHDQLSELYLRRHQITLSPQGHTPADTTPEVSTDTIDLSSIDLKLSNI